MTDITEPERTERGENARPSRQQRNTAQEGEETEEEGQKKVEKEIICAEPFVAVKHQPYPEGWTLVVTRRRQYGTTCTMDEAADAQQFVGEERVLRELVAKTQTALIVNHMCMCLHTDPRGSYTTRNTLLRHTYYAIQMVVSGYRTRLPVTPSNANPPRLLAAEAQKFLDEGKNSAAAQMLAAGTAAIAAAFADYFGDNSGYVFELYDQEDSKQT